MANKAKINDQYVNKFYGTVTESGANTLTFAEIPTNTDVFSKIAWVLQRLEWFPRPDDYGKLLANDDRITYALTHSNAISSLTLSDPAVIDLMQIGVAVGTAVGFAPNTSPLVRDFSGLPGGGIIIAPRPLYIAVKGTSLASALLVECRGYFTAVELSSDQYLDLVDFYRMIS